MSIIAADAIQFIKDLHDRPRTIIADPPYGMAYKSNIPGDKRWNKAEQAVQPVNKIINDESLQTINYPLFFKSCYDKLPEGGFLFLWANDHAMAEWSKQATNAGFTWKDTIFWDKEVVNGGDISWPFQQVVEMVLCLTKGKTKTYEIKNKFGDLRQKRANIFNIGRIRKEEKCGHPTQKPLFICQEIVRCSTLPGELVVDPFCGSGTSLLAAKLLGRKYAGCDLDPEHVTRALKRLEEETQEIADKYLYKYFQPHGKKEIF